MEDVEYCGDPARVAVFENAGRALLRLKAGGFRLVLITNQSGIGRGYFTEDDYERVHRELLRQLGSSDLFEAAYHCADAPDAATEHRKPAPGMILQAAREHGLDLARSYMVGDSARDIEAGRRARVAATILVLTGTGREQLAECHPDFATEDLSEAADWILRHAEPATP